MYCLSFDTRKPALCMCLLQRHRSASAPIQFVLFLSDLIVNSEDRFSCDNAHKEKVNTLNISNFIFFSFCTSLLKIKSIF